MADKEDRAGVTHGQRGQGQQGAADVLGPSVADGRIEEGDHGIDDYQAGTGRGQGVVEQAGLAGDAQGEVVAAVLRCGEEDPVKVGTKGLESGADACLGAVLGIQDNGVARHR
jgi:hypothetical protein